MPKPAQHNSLPSIPMSRLNWGLAALAMFFSGASALTYEILWQRRMFLVFGASAPATTAILTAIFLGIACGSRLAASRRLENLNPALLYALLELLIGGWGLLVPWGLTLADNLYVQSVARWGETHSLVALMRFLLAIIPLLPATLAMGATIPVMVRTISQPGSNGVSWAYGMNILGGMIGCLLTGFILIEHLGMDASRYVAFGFNLAACAVLLIIYRRGPQRDTPQVMPQPDRAAPSPNRFTSGSDSPAIWILPAYFAAGFVALGLEVVWLRFLGIVNSNSSITFTLTLSIYLAGMGLGSLLFYPLLRRWLPPSALFVVANWGTALASLLTFRVIYDAALINYRSITQVAIQGNLTIGDIYRAEALIIALLMFAPTICMGLAYPAICEMVQSIGSRQHRWIANAYFVGTLGSVAGILSMALVIIPYCGLHGAFAALVILSTFVGCLSLLQLNSPYRWLATGGIPLIIWAALIGNDPRPVLHETIARKTAGVWSEYPAADSHKRISDIVRFKAGATGTAIIKKTPGKDDYFVYVDDQLVASTNLDARVDSLVLAHLPLLLHPAPQSALTVGFGTGGTSFAMTTHHVDTYCVEIEPEVPRSAFLLTHQNFNVLDNPQFTLIINDARDHLHAGTRQYDVIATDVTNLQYKQNSSLYTVEYFDLMKQKLNAGGVACAWIPMAAIDTQELRILMNSFQHVFPHATLWFMNQAHTNFGILIGTPDPLLIDYRRVEAGFRDPAIAENLKLVDLTEPLQLIHCLHLDEHGYRLFCGNVPLHTDNRPVLEFSSPLSFYNYYESFRNNLAITMKRRPQDYQSYVRHAPDTLTPADWKRHQVASQSFCEVVLASYNFTLHRERGRVDAATTDLKNALQAAQAGMDAWPQDLAREEFYTDFFINANNWLMSQQPAHPGS